MMEDYGCWAKKRGDGKFDAFKARYFVVTGAVVDYYAGPKTEGPIDAPTLAASYEVKGSIALAEVSDFADGAAGKDGAVLRLTAPDRVFALAFADGDARRAFRAAAEPRAARAAARRAAELLAARGVGDATYSGFISKRGGSVKSWKKRFAVFKGGALSYYEDEDPAKAAKGSVDVVGAHAYDDADTAHHGYGLFVDVPTGGKKRSDGAFLMCARSAPERAAWLAALKGDDALFEAGAQLGASFEGVLDCSNGGATARRHVVLRGSLAVFYANEGDARAKRRAVGSCFLRGVREGDDGASRPASSSVDGADCVRPSVGGARDAAWNSNIQPDFNVRVFECFDTNSSTGPRELDASHRSVQKSAESTSM